MWGTDLTATISDSITSLVPGATNSYTINYGNSGTRDASGVTLTQILPAGTTFNASGSNNEEIRILKDKHKALWKFFVLVDRAASSKQDVVARASMDYGLLGDVRTA